MKSQSIVAIIHKQAIRLGITNYRFKEGYDDEVHADMSRSGLANSKLFSSEVSELFTVYFFVRYMQDAF